MAQPGGKLDLSPEALLAQHDSQLAAEHLERYPPLVPEVASAVHGRHAAPPERALDVVAPRERLPQRVGDRIQARGR